MYNFLFPFLFFFIFLLELGGNIPTASIFGGFKIFSPETFNIVCFCYNCYNSYINNYLLLIFFKIKSRHP